MKEFGYLISFYNDDMETIHSLQTNDKDFALVIMNIIFQTSEEVIYMECLDNHTNVIIHSY